jgi:anti-sigma factor RsiW
MSCDLEYSVVHSYFDGELGVIRAAEFRHHLAHCSDCLDEFAALSSLRGSLKYALLYETAPASLRLKIRWDLSPPGPRPAGRYR